MSEGEQPTVYHPEPQSNIGKWVLIVLAVVYAGASSFFIYDQHGKLDKLTQDQATSQKQVGDLTKRMQSAEADSETLATQLGMTKKELATRAGELQREQQAASAATRATWAARCVWDCSSSLPSSDCASCSATTLWRPSPRRYFSP